MSSVARSFSDVLMVPRFSRVKSRADVDSSVTLCGKKYNVGLISANMDTVTGKKMAIAISASGGVGCLHRFQTIEDNVKMYLSSPTKTWCSIGLGIKELDRAKALLEAGCETIVVDVAHGANLEVVTQTKALKELIGDKAAIVVGNFATGYTLRRFLELTGPISAAKVGIGGGSMCTTRVVTGNGLPTLESIFSCQWQPVDLIADGGIRNSGDFSKALAAGAKACMVGYLLAGTEESEGQAGWYNVYGEYKTRDEVTPVAWTDKGPRYLYDETPAPTHKKYRGSASLESYEVQGKVSSHRAPEGESTWVPYVGSVSDVIQRLEGGLRSSMSYQDAFNIQEFQDNVEFVDLTSNGDRESQSHGKDS